MSGKKVEQFFYFRGTSFSDIFLYNKSELARAFSSFSHGPQDSEIDEVAWRCPNNTIFVMKNQDQQCDHNNDINQNVSSNVLDYHLILYCIFIIQENVNYAWLKQN